MSRFRGAVRLLAGAAGVALAVNSFSAAADTTATGDTAESQRASIASQRVDAERRFAEREQDCVKRFVVTACLHDARQQRRQALAPLRQEELRLDLAERARRAADRLEEIEAKQQADAAREAASAPSPAVAPGGNAGSRPEARAPWMAPPHASPVDAAERQRREAESSARFDAQQADAARHRADVEKRNAQRAAQGKVARPLPAASGASGP